ncbi:MAG: YlxR family protein [Candidatus Obscuribacterales bacterium]|nr:YlxR family protein [Cyanobacteria bacterium HKST-UBA01]MCB9471251.1 YlxR family protein [Candidatus Obscuribacterales bacterium]
MEVGKRPGRICFACRTERSRSEMIRLTVDFKTMEVRLNHGQKGLFGRSAYLCKSELCLKQVEKGGRLKHALEGRKKKGEEKKRQIKWPLESQLIKAITELCTESDKTCQNTEN